MSQVQQSPEVVVITGSSSGVGRATARKFGEEGAHVALLARNEDGLNAAKEEIEESGGKALVVPTDVTDPDQIEEAAETVEEEFGPIDVWINVAMATVFSEFLGLDPDEFKRATEVTYLGYVYGTQTALKRMVPRDTGKVVQVGSALAYRGIPLQSAYCGSKFAIRGFTESVRTELMHDDSDVDITTVHLPGVNTPQFEHCRAKTDKKPRPMAPVFQPEVPADAIYWAAHNKRREMYVGRSTVKTIWGNKVAPWIVDRVLARNGYSGQFTDEDLGDRPDYLFSPVEGDEGAHGPFDAEAEPSSVQLELTKHREMIALALALVVGVVAKALK